jgi:predicted phage terminase large subunit-like protein
MRRSLAEFVKGAWPVVEPATDLIWNWHIDVIADALEDCAHSRTKRLLVNIPPRHMKSLLVTVFWPCWVWINMPHKRFLFASYAEALAVKHSVICRRLLQSDWYRSRWPHVQLAGDQNAKIRFETSHGGMRLATSVGGVVTGEGGDFIVVDDPHKADEAASETKRDQVMEWWNVSMSTRLNDPKTGVRVVIQQRLHEGDLAGHVIEQGGWRHICLPAEYDAEHKFAFPEDPRTERGELLWPARIPQDFLDEKKSELGSYSYAGQFQQLPAPDEGGILKRAWFRYYQEAQMPRPEQIIQSWDCAFKDSEDSDYVVGQVWARYGGNKYLMRQIRERLDFPQTVAAILGMTDWVANTYQELASHAVLIEDKANGPAVIASLRKELGSVIAVGAYGSKEARAHAVAPQLEAGSVYLPGVPRGDHSSYDAHLTPTWVQDLVEECAAFPNAMHDDQVDALAMALQRLGRHGANAAVRMGFRDRDALSDI